ncbi:MAG: type I methionyl aminopeptidase [Peptoniphilus harei]|nr:type I methionyl aminopeptidase [Peptoniphilus harei]
MIIIKTEDEIKKMQVAGRVLSDVHHKLRDFIKPGVKTIEIDRFVENYLKERGAYPEQKGYEGYPYSICASVNDEICHGFPTEYELKDGDIITVDMVVNVDGWLADSAWSYEVGTVSPEAKKLLEITRESMYKGIEKAVIGNRLGDIGAAVQKHAEENGYSVVREFVGHGIGQEMHEDPQVLHYGTAGRGLRIQEGMVFTIEPMINMGKKELTIDDNGWTARTKDGSLSAQYEHQIAITKDGPIIITDQGDC